MHLVSRILGVTRELRLRRRRSSSTPTDVEVVSHQLLDPEVRRSMTSSGNTCTLMRFCEESGSTRGEFSSGVESCVRSEVTTGQEPQKPAEGWNSLPPEIIENVLSFASVADVMKHRLISNEVNEITRSVEFCKQQTKRNTSDSKWMIHIPHGTWHGDDDETLSAYDPNTNEWKVLPIDFLPKGVVFKSSDGGIFLWADYQPREKKGFPQLYVTNPVTKSCRKLPQPLSERSRPAAALLVDAEAGYYKVVLAYGGVSATEEFDSRINSWKFTGEIIPNTSFHLFVPKVRCPKLYDGERRISIQARLPNERAALVLYSPRTGQWNKEYTYNEYYADRWMQFTVYGSMPSGTERVWTIERKFVDNSMKVVVYDGQGKGRKVVAREPDILSRVSEDYGRDFGFVGNPTGGFLTFFFKQQSLLVMMDVNDNTWSHTTLHEGVPEHLNFSDSVFTPSLFAIE